MSSETHSTLAISEGKASVVYVIDDDESMRLAVGDLLVAFGLRVETFASSQEFLAFPKHDGPSCLILDVWLRGASSFEFQQELARSGLHMPILFMTGYVDIEISTRAMKAGAMGIFPKPFRSQDMLDAIDRALKRDGERLEAEQLTASLRAAYQSLTSREKDVMAFVVNGLTNKEAASEMHLSEITVKIHRGQAMKKMSAHSLADLVRKAEALGIEPPRTK